MSDKFTILTASRDCSQYLRNWSQSIIEQEYRPLEVVFVDDYSKDDTKRKIRHLYP